MTPEEEATPAPTVEMLPIPPVTLAYLRSLQVQLQSEMNSCLRALGIEQSGTFDFEAGTITVAKPPE